MQYTPSDIVSSATNSVRRSAAAASAIAPTVENRSSGKNSERSMPCSGRYAPARSAARPPPRQSVKQKKSVKRSIARYGKSSLAPSSRSGPTHQSPRLVSAPANSATALPRASSAERPEPASSTAPPPAPSTATGRPNASASMRRSAPTPTTRRGAQARSAFTASPPVGSTLARRARPRAWRARGSRGSPCRAVRHAAATAPARSRRDRAR